MIYVYRFLWPRRFGWLLVCCLYKEVYLQIFKRVYTAVAGSEKVGPVNQVNHTSWVAVVTPTDRPKSVNNRCLIERFCGVVCVFTLPFWHFRWCKGFCHRTESDLLLFVLEQSNILWTFLRVNVLTEKFNANRTKNYVQSRESSWSQMIWC